MLNILYVTHPENIGKMLLSLMEEEGVFQDKSLWLLTELGGEGMKSDFQMSLTSNHETCWGN